MKRKFDRMSKEVEKQVFSHYNDEIRNLAFSTFVPCNWNSFCSLLRSCGWSETTFFQDEVEDLEMNDLESDDEEEGWEEEESDDE